MHWTNWWKHVAILIGSVYKWMALTDSNLFYVVLVLHPSSPVGPKYNRPHWLYSIWVFRFVIAKRLFEIEIIWFEGKWSIGDLYTSNYHSTVTGYFWEMNINMDWIETHFVIIIIAEILIFFFTNFFSHSFGIGKIHFPPIKLKQLQ